VATVSHELRTPLNMILGLCEMIVRAPDVYGHDIPSKLLADLDVVLRNSQHLSRLIDDVLDLGQMEADQVSLTRERVSFGQIVDTATLAHAVAVKRPWLMVSKTRNERIAQQKLSE
jgi:signal transduction histidine kinase